jgi:hypothetical protein
MKLKSLKTVTLGFLVALPLVGSLQIRSVANPNWSFPWQNGVSAGINGGIHKNEYTPQGIMTALDFNLGKDVAVLAPDNSTLIKSCIARGTRNHRTLWLRDSSSRLYILAHVSADTVKGSYSKGERIGVVAGDVPNDPSCAVSTGIHLHVGFPTMPMTIDGVNLPNASSATSRNGGGIIETGGIRSVNFNARTGPWTVKVRSGPGTNFPEVGKLGGNQPVNFSGWTFGMVIPDAWTNQPDARWYRLAGTNNWVASATISGNAPGSRPMP